MEAQGRIITKDWSLYDGHHVVTRTMNLSPYELQVEAIRAMTRFYSGREVAAAYTGNILRTAPFFAGLLLRDLKLSVNLPKIVVHALDPVHRQTVLNEVQRLVGYRDWSKILRRFAPLSMYTSNRKLVTHWAQAAVVGAAPGAAAPDPGAELAVGAGVVGTRRRTVSARAGW